MRLVVEKAARKGLLKMGAKPAQAMMGRLEAIATAPRSSHPNVERMAGDKDRYRLRQGGWRAVYRLNFVADEMRVTDVDVRGSVYR